MGKKKSARRKASVRHAAVEMAPLKERYRNWSYDGRWMDHGIQEIEVEVLSGGLVTKARAYLNTMEAPALDGLFRARVLDDPADENVRYRRLMAGVELRRIFHRSQIQAKSTGLYDKPLNAMISSSPQPQSNESLNNEVEFIRLMRLCYPYNTVVRNVCCLDERPPLVIRYGLATPCCWDVALRHGLDRIADEIFTRRNQPRRRHLSRPVIREKVDA